MINIEPKININNNIRLNVDKNAYSYFFCSVYLNVMSSRYRLFTKKIIQVCNVIAVCFQEIDI